MSIAGVYCLSKGRAVDEGCRLCSGAVVQMSSGTRQLPVVYAGLAI
jgi:hypothetical protein